MHTSGDVIHPELYVECKYRKVLGVLNWWWPVADQAKHEGKEPIVVMKQAGMQGEIAAIRFDFLVGLLKVAEWYADQYWGEPKETLTELVARAGRVE